MDKAVKFSNGCDKYSKTTDEIYEAAAKHREAAVKLKYLSEYKLKIEKLESKIEEQNNRK